MYVCMYVCMYACMYVRMYVCKYVYMYVCNKKIYTYTLALQRAKQIQRIEEQQNKTKKWKRNKDKQIVNMITRSRVHMTKSFIIYQQRN